MLRNTDSVHNLLSQGKRDTRNAYMSVHQGNTGTILYVEVKLSTLCEADVQTLVYFRSALSGERELFILMNKTQTAEFKSHESVCYNRYAETIAKKPTFRIGLMTRRSLSPTAKRWPKNHHAVGDAIVQSYYAHTARAIFYIGM